MPFQRRDGQLKVTAALPNGAANITSTSIDLTETSAGDLVAGELLLSAPAMNTTQMPDAKTMTYDLLSSVNADLSSPTTLVAGAIVQTGAGGVGCAAATFRYRPATTVKRYVGFKATGSAAGNSTTANGTLELLT